MELAGVGPKEAAEALAVHKEIWLAVDSLLHKPEISGEKYMPQKPCIDDGLNAEQKERCEKGRWLQEKVNAVFSVAHSKTRSLQDVVVPSVKDQQLAVDSESAVILPVSLSQQDAGEKTIPLARQSVDLQ
jgi:hypothetical protein